MEKDSSKNLSSQGETEQNDATRRIEPVQETAPTEAAEVQEEGEQAPAAEGDAVQPEKKPFFLSIDRSPILAILVGILLAGALLGMVLYTMPLKALPEGVTTNEVYGLILCSIVAGAMVAFRLNIRYKIGTLVYSVLYLLVPFGAFYMVEVYDGRNIMEFPTLTIAMSYVAYLILYLIFLVIFARYRWSVIFASITAWLFGGVCYFVEMYRGTPFVPLDILSSGTGMNVVANYNIVPSVEWARASVVCGLLIGIGWQLGNGNFKRLRWKLTMRVVALVAILGLVGGLFNQTFLVKHDYTISFWSQQTSYDKFGNWLAFCINLRYVYPEKPEGYSATAAEQIVKTYLAENGVDPEGDTSTNMLTGKNDYKATTTNPNVVVIMNESFCDLSQAGDVQTNIEVLPFFNSLKENTIRGTLQVSTFGGGTAGSEFEVLTGNAQRFLPAGSVAYDTAVRQPTSSMAWTLQQQGYATNAFHPYYKSGWSRPRAYPYLGFERCFFMEDIMDVELLSGDPKEVYDNIENFFNDKDRNAFNRLYMSDHYDYVLLEKDFEARDTSKPYFMFNVTIQNHGGYEYGAPNFEEPVKITNLKGEYPMAERFLSLAHASDTAFKELIEYFKKVKEPTVVVMFGDHKPSLDEGFYNELYGTSSYSTEQVQNYYSTPFVIWANYDIPEADIGSISANYLGVLTMQVAGAELTTYQKYLASLYRHVPVVSSVGFMDDKKNRYYYPTDTPFPDVINDYHIVSYNNLLDNSNRRWSLYTLNGEALPSVDLKKDDEK